MNPDFPAITELVPHRPPLLQVERVLSFSDNRIVCAMTVRADSVLVGEGGLPSWAGIELMAQAIAAHAGLLAHRAGVPVKKGFLLGSRDYKAERSSLPTGSALTISAEPLYQDDAGLGAFACVISGDGIALIKAQLNVFVPPNYPAFMAQREQNHG